MRRVNRCVAMSLAMARNMEVERIRVESMKNRIEEAFVQIKSVLIEVDKKHETLIEDTRKGAGVEFQRLSSEGSSVRDDLSRTKSEAEAALIQLKTEKESLLKSARDKFVMIEAEVKALAPQISSVGSSGGLRSSVDGSEFRKKNVLEYNIIKDYPVLGEEKKHFREWHYKLKSNLKAMLGPQSNLVKWMEIAEKDACSVKKESEQDPLPEVGVGRSEAAADIEAIMINKLQEGSEAYLILKRENDKIRAWRMIYAWYVKVSGQGLQTTM